MSATEFYQRSVSKLPANWHLMVIRVTIYSAMVGWGSFETGVEGYDTLTQLTTIQVIKLLGNIFVAMSGVWLAFLDQTLSKKNDLDSPRSPQQQPSQQPKQQ